MHPKEDIDFDLRRKIRMKNGSLYNVGLVKERIVGGIFQSFWVVKHRSTMLRMHRVWEMLGRVFLIFMKQ